MNTTREVTPEEFEALVNKGKPTNCDKCKCALDSKNREPENEKRCTACHFAFANPGKGKVRAMVSTRIEAAMIGAWRIDSDGKGNLAARYTDGTSEFADCGREAISEAYRRAGMFGLISLIQSKRASA